MKEFGRALAIAAAAIGLASCSFGNEEEVIFGSPTNAGVNLANLTAAMELGFFTDEGIVFRNQEFQGSSIVMTQVAVKSVDIGGGGAEPLILANETGTSKMPLEFFYNSMRNYIWAFVVTPDSNINSIADLKGKKIGVASLANAHMPATKLILRENGIDPETEVEFVTIGTGSPAFRALTSGQVDAYNTFNGNIALYEATGASVKYLPLPVRFANNFSFGYFVHKDTIRDKPEMLVGFGRAVAKGTVICREAPEWCVRNFWKYYPNVKPRNATEQDLAQQVYVLKQNMKSYLAYTDGEPQVFGGFPDDSWDKIIAILQEGGVLPQKKIDAHEMYTNKLIEQINDFDLAAVEAQGRALAAR